MWLDFTQQLQQFSAINPHWTTKPNEWMNEMKWIDG